MSENSSSTLMRKTKQELVNIILRKDNVAKDAQDEIKKLTTSCNETLDAKLKAEEYAAKLKDEVCKLNEAVKTKNINIKGFEKDIAGLTEQIEDLRKACDEYCLVAAEKDVKVRAWKICCAGITIAAILIMLVII